MTSKLLFAALIALCCAPLLALQVAHVPDAQTLQKMAARFAPTEIGADLSKLSAADRRVLAKLVEASKIIDALFLRQVWAGNEAMLLDLVRDQSPARPRAAALLPDQQGPVVAARSQPGLRAGRAAEAGGGQLLSGRRVEGGARALDSVAARGGARARDRILHGHPPRRQQLHASCRTASSIRASSRAPRRCCARRRSWRPSRR